MNLFVLCFYLLGITHFSPQNNRLADYLRKTHQIEINKEQQLLVISNYGCGYCFDGLLEKLANNKLKQNTFVIISLSERTIPEELSTFENKKNIYFDLKSGLIRANVGILASAIVICKPNAYQIHQASPGNIEKLSAIVFE
jgi:hypothetical protein